MASEGGGGRSEGSGRKHDDRAALRLLRAVLAATLVLSLALPALFSGAAWAWALPSLAELDAGIVASAVGLGVGLVTALWLFALLHERVRSPALRWAGVVAVCTPLAAIFNLVGREAHFGDWDWVIDLVEQGKLYARWYGATAAYGAFHRLARTWGATPVDSVRWFSSLCGAASVYVYYHCVRQLGETRGSCAWALLYCSAFGAIGVGLGYVEIYAVVVLVMTVTLYLALRVLETPDERTVLWLAVATSAAIVTYASGAFLLPGVVSVLLHAAWTAHRERRTTVAVTAIAALALIPLLVWTVARLGPDLPGGGAWAIWTAELRDEGREPPPFLPADAFWSWLPTLMAPRYWFAGWHLRDFALHLFTGDRAGVAVAAALLVPAMTRGRGAKSSSVIFLAGTAAIFLAFGFAAIHRRPQPWDWDVWSHFAVLTNLLAVALLFRLVPGWGRDRTTSALLAAIGAASLFGGLLLFGAHARLPSQAGPAVQGLSLAVTPERVQIGRGGRALRPVFFWLVNRTDQPRHLSTDQILYRLETLEPDARSGARQVRHMLGDRDLPAAGAVCLANVSKLTQPGLISSAQGRVRAVLHAYFTLMGMGRQSLTSNEIEIEVVP